MQWVTICLQLLLTAINDIQLALVGHDVFMLVLVDIIVAIKYMVDRRQSNNFLCILKAFYIELRK